MAQPRSTTAQVRLFEAKDQGDIDFLLNALEDSSIRFLAAKFLGELKAGAAVTPLISLLGAGDRATRSSAAEALGLIGDVEAVSALIDRLQVEEEVVPRTFVITALGKLGDARALTPLCDLLFDQEILIRQSAAHALGVLGHAEALGPLLKASSSERWYNRGRHRQAISKLRTRR